MAAVAALSWFVLGAQQPQRFTASASTVRVDVVVTADGGRFVEDLRPEEFRLFEDDAAQEIVGVQLVDLRAPRLRSAETSSGGPVAVAGGIDQARPLELGAVVLLVDIPGLYLQNKIRFEDALNHVLSEVDSVSVPHAVYLIDAAGRLRRLQALTMDVEALRQAADAAREVPAVKLLNEDLLYEGALDNGDMWTPETRWARYEERRRTTYTYRLLRAFVDSLAHRNGRTALIWVSTGVDLAVADVVERPYRLMGREDPISADPFASYSPDDEIRRLQEELHHAANTANVSIYSVDPTALYDFYITGGGLKERIGSVQDARGNSLRHAAAATGGEAFIGWTDLERVLETIEADSSRFYLLSYIPSGVGTSGEYHEIRVEVDRPNVEVRARPGYVWYSDADRRARILRGALGLPGTVSGLDIAVEATRARGPAGEALVIIDTFLDRDDEGRGGSILDPRSVRLYEIVLDDGAELVAELQGERFTQGLTAGPGTQVVEVEAGGYWMHRAVHRLEAGTYDVRVAAIDPASERVGASELKVEVRDASEAWDASDPWLTIQHSDGSRSPLVGGRVESGQAVVAYFEVYSGVSPAVGGRVRPRDFTTGSNTPNAALSRETDRLPRESRGPAIELTEAGGIHRGWIPLSNLPVGTYVLEFDIDDVGAGRARTVQLPLEVLETARR